MKLVVAACLGGTDYCENQYGKSLGTSRKILAGINSVLKADSLMLQVRDALLNCNDANNTDCWLNFCFSFYIGSACYGNTAKTMA